MPTGFPRLEEPGVFISASKDMHGAAMRVKDLVLSLNRPHKRYQVYYWPESEKYHAWDTASTYQNDIPRTSDVNAVMTISLFGERIGQSLPKDFNFPKELTGYLGPAAWRRDGSVPRGKVPLTGTLFEYLDARHVRMMPQHDPLDATRLPHMAYICGDNRAVIDRSLQHDQRTFGFGRWKRKQQTENDDKEYWQQLRWLATFVDWMIGEGNNIPLSCFGTAGQSDEELWEALANDLRPSLERELFGDPPRWVQLKGLDSYEIKDHRGFYGRAGWIEHALANLEDRAARGGVALLLTGPSGIGKSSALKAGLLGKLQARNWRLGAARRLVPCLWSLRDLTAEDEADPLVALARHIGDTPGLAALGGGEAFADLLRGLPEPKQAEWFDRRLREALGQEGDRPGGRLLLAIDQFEEIADRVDAAGALPEAWLALMRTLLASVDSGLVWLLATRSTEREAALRTALGDMLARFDVQHIGNPDRENLSEIINRSLTLVELSAEKPLCERLVEQAVAVAGDATPVLPLLSMHLTRLVQIHDDPLKDRLQPMLPEADGRLANQRELRADAFSEHLDLANTIRELAEQAWEAALAQAQLPDMELRLARLLGGLIGVEVGQETFEPRLLELPAGSRAAREAVHLIPHFQRRRLLSPTGRDGWRLSHRSVLKAWPRAGAWFDGARELAEFEATMTGASLLWLQAKTEERAPLLLKADMELRQALRLLVARGVDLTPPLRNYLTDSLVGRPDIRVPVSDEMELDPLTYAARAGELDLVKMLLAGGASDAVKTEKGSTPLMFAANEGHADVVRYLLTRPFDPGARNAAGNGPLHFAAFEGHLDVVDLLLQVECAADLRNKDGQTPLHFASSANRLDVVRLLLTGLGSADLRDNQQWTPLHVAAANGHVEVVRALIDAGAERDARDGEQWTPLHLAAHNGHAEVVRALIDARAEPDARNDRQWTPLHLAAQSGHAEVVRALLNGGADRDAREHRQVTPLHLAAQNGHASVVAVLLAANADPAAAGVDGSALDAALRAHRSEVAAMLLKAGAACKQLAGRGFTNAELPLRFARMDWSPVTFMADVVKIRTALAVPAGARLDELRLAALPDSRLLRVTLAGPVADEDVLHFFLLGPKALAVADGTNGPFYAFASASGFDLDHPNIEDWAIVFFSLVMGRHGRFVIVETANDVPWLPSATEADRRDIAPLLHAMVPQPVELDRRRLRACMVFLDSLVEADIIIQAAGRTDLGDPSWLLDDLPIEQGHRTPPMLGTPDAGE